MTTIEKKSIDTLDQILKNLENDEMHVRIIHLKSALDLLERKFKNDAYLDIHILNVKNVVNTLERDMRFKTKADRKYYGNLISMAGENLVKIHSTLSEKMHIAGD